MKRSSTAWLAGVLLACCRAQAEPADVQPVVGEPTVLITDREALAHIERRVANFGALALAMPAENNAALATSPAYRSVIEPLESDLRAQTAGDPQAGVSVRGHAHRTFDVRWLRASSARFELVAIANRMDRRAFERSGCGEIRLIYRLAYAQREGDVTLASRLPLTIALELRAEPDTADCTETARRWFAPGLQGRALAERLLAEDGPLASSRMTRTRLIQLALNVQAVRWPSAVRPDLGGHAEYLLRAFRWDQAQERYLPRKLENTPDVARLLRDRAAKAQLRAWLQTQLPAIDAGYAQLPERFLAEVASSVTPRGLSRLANRPFRQLFAPRELAFLPLSEARFVRSPEAFLRRLDELSCVGCHQARSVAGFHVLGGDDASTLAANALAIPHSPHVEEDLPRRRAYVLALANRQSADDASPFAEHSDHGGGYGAHCGLGDPGFASWVCAPGLHCDASDGAVGEQTVGTCVPDVVSTGDACEPARVRAHRDAHRDGVQRAGVRACPEICEATRVGFPSGMCVASCGVRDGITTCGGIAILTPFNDCLARSRPFAECASLHVRPAGLRGCDRERPCRDDYLCARTASGEGACLPPYFVFQMRVDGHPAPSK